MDDMDAFYFMFLCCELYRHLNPIAPTKTMLTFRRRSFQKRVKVRGFIRTINWYRADDFKHHFRLRRSSVEVLLADVVRVAEVRRRGRPPIPTPTGVLVTLWYLANLETYRQVSDRFDLGKGSSCDIVVYFLQCIAALLNRYIHWPTPSQQSAVGDRFDCLRTTSIPGVIGCIDGAHIRISCPKHLKQDYTNRKMFQSIILQGVCNDKMEFINIFVGWPGRSHDARVFRNSGLGLAIMDRNYQVIAPGFHLLGDGDYPLSEMLIVPFKDYGNLTNAQRGFNRALSSQRVVIEQAFGLLLGRFRRLKLLDMKTIKKMSLVVTAACILHNLCLKEGDEMDIDVNIDDSINVQGGLPPYEELDGCEKRAALTDWLHNSRDGGN